MVDAHAGAQQTLQDLAERGRELRSLDGLGDRRALLFARHAGAGQRVGRLQCGVLGEMDHIDRRLVLAERQLDGFLQWVERVLIGQRHRPRRVGDDVDVGVGHILQLVGDGVDVAERRAHQQELGVRQRQQRHLPRPSAFGIAVIVEFIHRDAADIGVPAFAQRLVREDLRGAADDRRVGVDMRVAGDHADIIAAEHLHQIEELLRDERLDRRRVIGAPSGAQRGEMHAERHQRFAGAGRRVQNDVVAREQAHDGLFLMRPWFDALDVLDPAEEALVDLVGVDVALAVVPIRSKRPQRAVIRVVSHACQFTRRHEPAYRTCVRIMASPAVQ